MARKKKKKLKMPPLSALDSCVYYLGMALCVILGLSLSLFVTLLTKRIGLSDPEVIAVDERATVLLGIFPYIAFLLLLLCPICTAYSRRIPIFGKKGIQYGPPKYPKVYPIFMKDKPPVWVSDRKKESRKTFTVFYCLLVILCLLPTPAGVFGRSCLMENGDVAVYNFLNREIQRYHTGDIQELCFYPADMHPRSRGFSYDLNAKLTMENGKTFYFDAADFRGSRNSEPASWLVYMLDMKDRVSPDRIIYKDPHLLPEVADTFNLSSEEIELMKQLFDIS